MKDGRSSLLSALPLLSKNLVRFVVSKRPKRPFLRRVLAEVKIAASKIEPVHLDALPGMAGVSATVAFRSNAAVAFVAKAIGAKEVFEFGTHLGQTAMEIAENCPECQIVTLDLPLEYETEFEQAQARSEIEITDPYLFKSRRGSLIKGGAANRIRQIRQDSARFDPRLFAGRFDLIYIDASHSYSGVKSDTEKALAMLKPSGVIIWDDYLYPGVWRYLNELAEARPELPLRYLYDLGKVILLPT